MRDADVVIVGAGAAGLALAEELTAPAFRGLTLLLIDAPAGPLRPPARTWCFWEAARGRYDAVLTASWERLRVTGRDGEHVLGRTAPLRYKMLRSAAFEELVGARLSRAGAGRVEAVVEEVRDVPGGGAVHGRDADGNSRAWHGRWVFDSRPRTPLPPARTTLVQHFQGWFVRTARPAFDAGTADWMDFRTPQPAHGLSFGYVLPLGPREALVEYTEFSRAPLDGARYDEALRHYTADVLGLDAPAVTATERGAIPMTDGRFPRRAGRSVFRIGTAGGATRPSTGYTFTAVRRQSRRIARALAAGRPPVPPAPYSVRARAMDAALLRALDTGRVDGAEFFTGLFRAVPTARLLRFLDGGTGLLEDLGIGLRTPVGPMLRTVAELPLLPRRSRPSAAPSARPRTAQGDRRAPTE